MGGIYPPPSPAFQPPQAPIAIGSTVGDVLTVTAANTVAFAPPAAGGLTEFIAATAADRTVAAVGNDPTLAFSNLPAGTWAALCGLYFDAPAGVSPVSGFNRGGTFVTGIQAGWCTSTNDSLAFIGARAVDGGTLALGVTGVALQYVELTGFLVFSSSSNSIVLQWGPGSTGNMTLKQGSWMRLTKAA